MTHYGKKVDFNKCNECELVGACRYSKYCHKMRLINADAIEYDSFKDINGNTIYYVTKNKIDNAPTIYAVHQPLLKAARREIEILNERIPHAEWIPLPKTPGRYKCSSCGAIGYGTDRYCRMCGSKMDDNDY